MCQRKNVAHKYRAERLLWLGSAHEITGRERLHHLQSLQSAPGLLHPGLFYSMWERFAFINSWWEGSFAFMNGRWEVTFAFMNGKGKQVGLFSAKPQSLPISPTPTLIPLQLEEIQFLEKQNCVMDLLMCNPKHCQRHNGPEGWVHIISSNTNLDQISFSESRPSINFKISTKHQPLHKS